MTADRMLQRLSARGRVDVSAMVRGPGWRDGKRERAHLWFSVTLVPNLRRHRGLFWDMVGWDHVTAEGSDLDALLADVLERSRPPFKDIAERVADHWDFLTRPIDPFAVNVWGVE